MPEICTSKHVLLHLIHVVLGVRILLDFVFVFRRTFYASRCLDCELWPEVARAHCASDYVKAKQSTVAHAQTNISRLQATFHRIGFASTRWQDIPGLWFAAVLARIRSALVCSSQVIEEHDVDRGWAETGQFQVVRNHELIIWSMAPLQRKALCCLTVLLLFLLWPREEEAARCTVFQAVQNCAIMDVEKRLHCPQQESPQQGLPRPTELLIQIQTDQFSVDPCSFCTIVHIVFCVHCGVASF